MDAVKFLEERNRICNKYAECSVCPLWDKLSFCKISICNNRHKEAVQIVEEWAKNNPVKTRQSEFLKVFPRTFMLSGVIGLCPLDLDSDFPCQAGKCSCIDCKKGYWFEEVE